MPPFQGSVPPFRSRQNIRETDKDFIVAIKRAGTGSSVVDPDMRKTVLYLFGHAGRNNGPCSIRSDDRHCKTRFTRIPDGQLSLNSSGYKGKLKFLAFIQEGIRDMDIILSGITG